MKKPFLLTFFFSAFFLFSFSQSELLVKISTKGLYVEHKVAPKENFYSIGRVFNVHPKHLAAFNGLDMSKGLSLDQVVNVPLSDTNFSRLSAQGIPVYYKSSAKQTAGSVSAISKTSAENVRKWNKLQDDNISPGTSVIIGYLLTSGEEVPAPAETTAVKTDTEKQTKSVTEVKKEAVKEQPAKQDEPKAVVPAKTEPPKEEPKAIIKEETAKDLDPETVQAGDGYFKIYFTQQAKTYPLTKDEIVTSGIFKTTSGWNDGKYYALLDGVEPGTIIKVVNPANSKVVYAKVLGQMSGVRQNQGLNLRISNAAASVLEISEIDKFIVKVNY